MIFCLDVKKEKQITNLIGICFCSVLENVSESVVALVTEKGNLLDPRVIHFVS